MKQSNKKLSMNYRVLIGIAVIIEAYLLYFNSAQRQSFHSQITSMGAFFDIQMKYQAIQSVRYTFIAVTYSFGLAILLDVGKEYFVTYFEVKICYEILFGVFGKDPIKCLLLICVHIGFIIILKNRIGNQSNLEKQNEENQQSKANFSNSQIPKKNVNENEVLQAKNSQN